MSSFICKTVLLISLLAAVLTVPASAFEETAVTAEFSSQELANMYAQGLAGQPIDDLVTTTTVPVTTTTGPGTEYHPADTTVGMAVGDENWRISSTEILAYANAFLTDDDPTFPGISAGNRSAYVLRGAAIFLANFQARYEDVGTAEPPDSPLHPARWQELPDL